MFDYPDFANGQNREAEPSALALPYDFFEHVVQQNKRDDDSRAVYNVSKEPLRAISYAETCERCGKNLGHVYLWNKKRLCKSCLEAEQDKWVLFTGSPNSAPQRVSMRPLKKENSLIESLFLGFLAFFSLQRIETAGIPEPRVQIKRTRFQVAQRPDRKQMPEAEGIMGSIKIRLLLDKLRSKK